MGGQGESGLRERAGEGESEGENLTAMAKGGREGRVEKGEGGREQVGGLRREREGEKGGREQVGGEERAG